jgi:hypothetical protein
MRRGTMVRGAEAGVEGVGDRARGMLFDLALGAARGIPTLPEAKRREPDSVLPGSRNQGTGPHLLLCFRSFMWLGLPCL